MRLHLIANSHIDPVWLWDKYEGIDEVLNTFRSACDRLDEFPELFFSASSLQFHQWCRDYDAALLARIQQYVAAGRWEITGPWWIEPDSNLPTEASVRKQQELSQRFIDDHFEGRHSGIAFLPDTFGHPATLPKLLAETGQRYFIFCRPSQQEKDDLPANLFYWEYGEHRVLAYRLKHHYTQSRSTDAEVVGQRLSDAEYKAQPTNAFLFGVGDHGGGPTVAEIELYRRCIADKSSGDTGFSTLAAFFAEAELLADIPTYSGDLHGHAVGCYSVLRDLKQQIRTCEQGLGFTERAQSMSGTSADGLTPLWHKTLFNQFHDILPGSCSPAAAHMARAEMGGVEDGWRTLAYESLKVGSAKQPVACATGEFRIFNTLPYEVTTPLVIESFQYFVPGAEFRNAAGETVEIQEILPSVWCNNRRWAFVDTLPPGGFNTYHFYDEGLEAARSPSPAHFTDGDTVITGRFKVSKSGAVTTVNGGELIAGPRFLVLDDASDTWGHGVVRYDDVVGAFEMRSVTILTGNVTRKLYQRWTYERSSIDVIYSLFEDLPWVDMEVTVNWAEDRRILKVELAPADCSGESYLMQGPGGAIDRRANGHEQPLHHWVAIQGKQSTFAVIQDGAFAGDCVDGRLRLNLVRSNLYGYHEPNTLDPRDPQHRTDQGLHRFRFRLFFDDSLDVDVLNRRAETLLEPFWVIRESGATR